MDICKSICPDIEYNEESFSFYIFFPYAAFYFFCPDYYKKRWSQRCKFQWDKPLYYIMIGYALKVCIYGIKILFHQKAVFQWFEDTGIPWYMFAMAAFMVIAYLIKELPLWFVLPISILAACIG